MVKRGKSRSRANGEGTVYQSGPKAWVAQISIPGGRRKSKSFPTQREARKWLTEIRREIDTENFIEPSKMTLDEYWSHWVKVYKSRSVSDATLESYRCSRERLPIDLLSKPIGLINTNDIQNALNQISDKGLKRRTVEITRTALNMVMNRAVKDRLIRTNPVSDTVLPENDAEEAVPLTHEEEAKFVEFCKQPPRLTATGKQNKRDLQNQPLKDALLFILRTGLRKSECLNLTWEDWNDQMIHVRGTKNDAADRMVPLNIEAVEILQRRNADRQGNLVFTQMNGRPIDEHNILQYMKEKFGHTVHELRHTFCTRAAQAGVNPKVLQTITGHKKLETLLKIYTHVTEQDQVNAIDKIFGYCKPTANVTEVNFLSDNDKSPAV